MTKTITAIIVAAALTSGCTWTLAGPTISTNDTPTSTYPTTAPYDYGPAIEYPTVTP